MGINFQNLEIIFCINNLVKFSRSRDFTSIFLRHSDYVLLYWISHIIDIISFFIKIHLKIIHLLAILRLSYRVMPVTA